ncbi:MAG: PD-(D/E)XK nuclease family protein [Acidobacteria bacterium]|nr:PD-(D/E)XK nuclease family protein [Acidobacteriota bacterium]
MDAAAVAIARGARAVERLVLDDLAGLLRPAAPESLGGPLLVVVSTGTLRQRVAARVARRFGPAVLGVKVLTLFTLARELLARAGEPVAEPNDLWDLIARREARKQDALAPLGEFRDGHGLAAATMRDLLSAGFEPRALERCERALVAAMPGPAGERGLAVLRAAAAASAAMSAARARRPGDLLSAAAARLRESGPALLGARAVLIHGFADATGRQCELLAAIAAHPAAKVYFDEPPDPAEPARRDAGAVFLHRFRERLGLPDPGTRAAGGPPATIHAFDAVGREAEARELAHRVRALLDAGVEPEEIGVVARPVDAYAVTVRREFERRGIPFSGGPAPAGLFPVQRRLAAALELLEARERASVDAWLEAGGPDLERDLSGERRASIADVRAALRSAGAGRLFEAAALDADALLGERDGYPLPVRRGVRRPGEDDAAGEAVLARRYLPGSHLRGALRAARELARHLAGWPERASAGQHVRRGHELFARLLGWGDERTGAAWREALDAVAAAVPASWALGRDEFLLVFGRRARAAGAAPLGGDGAGVQVLELPRARGASWEHLFLLGANRDVFPRLAQDDPLLPDTVRAALRGVLPHLPLKAHGEDEERYLFAQLLASAREVTVSWRRADDEGKALDRSPLLERLALAARIGQPVSVPRLRAEQLAATRDAPGRRLDAREALQLAGLLGSRALFARLLPGALDEACERWGRPATLELARARVEVLDEYAPDWRTRDGYLRGRRPGPYLGFILPRGDADDPRPEEPSVTTLEALAGCPWRALLARVLRLETVADPLGELPALDPLLVGRAVHGALERLLRERGRRARPRQADVDRAARAGAVEAARDAGVHLPGLHHALVARVVGAVNAALDVDWPDAGSIVEVLEVEARRRYEVPDGAGAPRGVRFRADRVDRTDGGPRLTDYKTGRALSEARTPDTRVAHLRAAIEAGQQLQAAVYAGSAPGAIGRYLYLSERVEDDQRQLEIRGTDPAVLVSLPRVLAALLAAWDAGAFFPRLVNHKDGEPYLCQRCELSPACVRGDTNQRARVTRAVRAASEARERGESLAPQVDALLGLWPLGRDPR